MYVFGHHDVSDHDKAVALSRLLQNRKESVARPRGVEKMATAGNRNT
jgi:hypothetical protein